MRKIRFRNSSVPFSLLFFCLISFGLLIPWLGFFWDDWPSIWYLQVFGSSGFSEVFAIDRPLLGYFFMLTTRWLGTSMVGWQLFGILTRWLCVLAFWWLLRGLWPKYPSQAAWTALLFAVYPGFKQQYISVTYSHVWILAVIFFLSLATMVWAYRKPRISIPLTISSWSLSALALFSVEYFFGLELIRPFILWMLVSEEYKSLKSRIKITLIKWSPYLVISAIFLYWRLVLYQTERGNVQLFEKLSNQPIPTIIDLIETAGIDIINSGIVAWIQTADFTRMTSFGTGPTILYLVGAIAATVAAIFYLNKFRPTLSETDSDINQSRSWPKQAIFLGGMSLIFGGIPFWVTNLPIGLEFPWDRFTLAMIFGSTLLVAGLVDFFTRTRFQKILVFGVLIGLASGLHIQYGNLYRREWNAQSQFFWQLTWRAPAIQPNTLLLTAELPFVYFSDNSLTAPLNWIYAPDFREGNMPYLLYAAEARHEVSLPNLKADIPVNQPYRATQFEGNTNQTLVLFYTPPGCLKIVNPHTDKRMPQKPNYVSDMMPLSRLELILTDVDQPARPPQAIFGEQPPLQWCYFFEKADLARQFEDWEQVASLADQALQLGETLYEVNAPELVTFIEGYAHTGRWSDALELTDRALALSERMDRMLCDSWKRIANVQSPDDTDFNHAWSTAEKKLTCLMP
jgi:hypothetical protein